MRNVFLFIILVLLIIFIYFFEEIGGKNRRQVLEQEGLIFDAKDLGELKGFKTQNAELIKGRKKYYTVNKHVLVDDYKVNQVFALLSKIKVKRYLTDEEVKKQNIASYFPEDTVSVTFIFNDANIKFNLGYKLDFDESFYMEVENANTSQWIIAYDSGPMEGIYSKKNRHNSSNKYDRIKSLLLLDDKFFYDMYIFKAQKKDSTFQIWDNVKINNIKEKKSFDLSFSKLQTSPNIFKGLIYNKKAIKDFGMRLLSLRGIDITTQFSKIGLKNLLLKLEFNIGFDNAQDVFLYSSYKGKNGFFLITDFDDVLYELEESSAKVLFQKYQSFWDKRIFALYSNLGKTDIFFEIKFKDETRYQLKIPASKEFDIVRVIQDDPIPKIKSFKKLFSFFMERGANYSTIYSSNDYNLLKDEIFSLRFEKMHIHVVYNKGELILINKTFQYKLHYEVGDLLPVKSKRSDFFILKKKKNND